MLNSIKIHEKVSLSRSKSMAFGVFEGIHVFFSVILVTFAISLIIVVITQLINKNPDFSGGFYIIYAILSANDMCWNIVVKI